MFDTYHIYLYGLTNFWAATLAVNGSKSNLREHGFLYELTSHPMHCSFSLLLFVSFNVITKLFYLIYLPPYTYHMQEGEWSKIIYHSIPMLNIWSCLEISGKIFSCLVCMLYSPRRFDSLLPGHGIFSSSTIMRFLLE